MKSISFIINCVTLGILTLQCASMPLVAKILDKKLKGCLISLTQKPSWKIILVFVFAFILVGLQFAHEFQLVLTVVLDCIAIMAIDMSIKDYLYQKKAGVYENCLITDGRKINRSDIIALPTLEYEESEEYKKEKEEDEYAADAYETAMKSLKIVSKSRGEFYVGFNSAEERAEAVKIIRTWIS